MMRGGTLLIFGHTVKKPCGHNVDYNFCLITTHLADFALYSNLCTFYTWPQFIAFVGGPEQCRRTWYCHKATLPAEGRGNAGRLRSQ